MDKITTHVADAVARLLSQHQKPNTIARQKITGDRAQVLENSLYTMALTALAGRAGDQLDGVGGMVGQAREGMSDSDYRLWIAARILVNQSSGTGEDLLALLACLRDAIGGAPGHTAELEEWKIFTIISRMHGAITAAQAMAIGRLLTQDRAGGVRGLFEYSLFDDVSTLEARGYAASWPAGLASAVTSGTTIAGATLIPITGSSGSWPSSGCAIIGRGSSYEEAVFYSAYSGGALVLIYPAAMGHAPSNHVDQVPLGNALGHVIAESSTLDIASAAGDDTLQTRTTGFPGSGVLLVDGANPALREEVVYHDSDDYDFYLDNAMTHAHAIGATIELVADIDIAETGHLAGAEEA
jgi:hypothetical protein